eukprot:1559025-Pleurochrysis_carterae.AAC.4
MAGMENGGSSTFWQFRLRSQSYIAAEVIGRARVKGEGKLDVLSAQRIVVANTANAPPPHPPQKRIFLSLVLYTLASGPRQWPRRRQQHALRASGVRSSSTSSGYCKPESLMVCSIIMLMTALNTNLTFEVSVAQLDVAAKSRSLPAHTMGEGQGRFSGVMRMPEQIGPWLRGYVEEAEGTARRSSQDSRACSGAAFCCMENPIARTGRGRVGE